MTVLHRVAQLIKDLRTLDVIKREDSVRFTYINVTTLMIMLKEHDEYDDTEKRIATIDAAITEEFPKDSFDYLIYNRASDSIWVCFKPKE